MRPLTGSLGALACAGMACTSDFVVFVDRTPPAPPPIEQADAVVFERFLTGSVGGSTTAFARLSVRTIEPGARLRVYLRDVDPVDDAIAESEPASSAPLIVEPLNLADSVFAVWVATVDEAGNESCRRRVRDGRMFVAPIEERSETIALTRVGARSHRFALAADSNARPLNREERRRLAEPDLDALAVEPVRVWRRVPNASDLTIDDPASSFSVVFDRHRGRSVLFGAFQETRPKVREFDGSQWYEFESVGPTPTWNGAMTYDVGARRSLLYGGRLPAWIDSRSCPQSLWSWDGVSWTELTRSGGPGCAERHALVYDEARGHTVLFGGTRGPGEPAHQDLWIFDGETWAQVEPKGPWPSPRYRHAMAFDVGAKEVVLFGGCGTGGCGHDSATWVWNGNEWSSFDTASHPPPGRTGRLVYVPELEGLLFFSRETPERPAEAWLWRHRTWTPVVSALRPPMWYGSSEFVYDSANRELLLMGSGVARSAGERDDGALVAFDLWAYRNGQWTPRRVSERAPPGRGEAAGAYDPKLGAVVVFGGGGPVTFSDTWALQGWRWTQLDPAPVGLGPRFGAAMAYLPVHDGVVLVGGAKPNSNTPTGDAWIRTMQGWELLQTSNSSVARTGHLFLGEPGRESAIVVGDRERTLPSMRFTASRDWVELGSDGPANGGDMAGALDEDHGCVWVFGGEKRSRTDVEKDSDDLWCWDGTAWRKEERQDVWPEPRTAAALAYDPLRHRALLHGGEFSSAGSPPHSYEWDGQRWHPLLVHGPSPHVVSSQVLAYDASAGAVVLFGGYDRQAVHAEEAFSNETWLLPSRDAGAALRVTVAWPPLPSFANPRSVAVEVMAPSDGGSLVTELWREASAEWISAHPPAVGRPATFAPVGDALSAEMALRVRDVGSAAIAPTIVVDWLQAELRYVVDPVSDYCPESQER